MYAGMQAIFYCNCTLKMDMECNAGNRLDELLIKKSGVEMTCTLNDTTLRFKYPL